MCTISDSSLPRHFWSLGEGGGLNDDILIWAGGGGGGQGVCGGGLSVGVGVGVRAGGGGRAGGRLEGHGANVNRICDHLGGGGRGVWGGGGGGGGGTGRGVDKHVVSRNTPTFVTTSAVGVGVGGVITFNGVSRNTPQPHPLRGIAHLPKQNRKLPANNEKVNTFRSCVSCQTCAKAAENLMIAL